MARVSRHRPKIAIHATRESMMNDARRAESGDESQGSAESFHQRLARSELRPTRKGTHGCGSLRSYLEAEPFGVTPTRRMWRP